MLKKVALLFVVLSIMGVVFWGGCAHAESDEEARPGEVTSSPNVTNNLSSGTSQIRASYNWTNGYQYLGSFTASQLKNGLDARPNGMRINSSNYSPVLQEFYPEPESAYLIRRINPTVTLPHRIPQGVEVYPRLADVFLGTDDTLPAGNYSAKVIQKILEPDGSISTPYVEYEFDIIEPEMKVDVLGGYGLIYKIAPNGYALKNTSILNEEFLANWGDVVQGKSGLSADGNSRLFVRIQSETPGPVSLTTSAETLGIKIETLTRAACNTSSIPLVQVADNLYQATVVLVAPKDWPGGSSTDGELAFKISVSDSDGRTGSSPELRLAKTPVVLVHGIWSDEKAFDSGWLSDDGIRDTLERSGFGVVNASHYTNSEGPSHLADAEKAKQFYNGFIRPALQKAIDNGIEASRVDIVAHSMGGLYSKAFTRTEWYKSELSYGERLIRRLITIGTPHWGSGFASYICADTRYLGNAEANAQFNEALSSMIRNPSWEWDYDALPEVAQNWVRTVNALGLAKPIGDWTALSDLSIQSVLVNRLNGYSYDLPMYLIVGDQGENFLSIIAWGERQPLVTYAPYTHQDMFRVIGTETAEASDGIVGLSSASWITGTGNFPAMDTYNVWHTDMGGKSQLISDRVVALLNGPETDFHVPTSPRTLSRNASANEFNAKADTFEPIQIPQFPENIVLTPDKFEAAPGETVNILATAQGQLDDVMFVCDDWTLGESVTLNPDGLGLKITIPAQYSGVFTVAASSGLVDGEIAQSNKVSIVVKPDLSKLSLIVFSEGSNVTYPVGSSFSLGAEGALSDGTVFDISRREMGTTYTSSNTAVAKVSENGEVEVLAPGDVTITARNGDCGTILYLRAIPFEDEPLNTDVGTEPSEPTQPSEPTAPSEPAGSSGGGCSTGAFGLMTLFALGAAVCLKRR